MSFTVGMQDASQTPLRRFSVLGPIALPFLLVGGYMVGIGLGWIPIDPSRLHAPGWVLAVLGLPFLGTGLYILDIGWISQLRNLMAVMLLAFVVSFNWAAFTDDPLCFKNRDQARARPGRVICQEDTEAKRLPIIVAAVLSDIVVVAFVARDLRRRFRSARGSKREP